MSSRIVSPYKIDMYDCGCIVYASIAVGSKPHAQCIGPLFFPSSFFPSLFYPVFLLLSPHSPHTPASMSSRPITPTQEATIVSAPAWSPTSWQSKPIKQDVDYPDQAHLSRVLEKISRLPPMVVPGEVCQLLEAQGLHLP